MMSIYPIVRIQLPFDQFSLLCYEFCILSKTEWKNIFRRDHESSSFRKLAKNKWICRATWFFMFIIAMKLDLSIIILEPIQVLSLLITRKPSSNSANVTGNENLIFKRINGFGNLSSLHCLIVDVKVVRR